jgi:hypothetical protein
MIQTFNTGIFANYNGELIPIRSIGDTLGLTTTIKRVYELTGKKSKIVTILPELFLNNPYVEDIILDKNVENILSPCLEYSCNIQNHYASQIGIELLENTIPEIYFSDGELLYAEEQLKEFKDRKKIAVCLKSSTPNKDLTYEIILPLLSKLKSDGYMLIGFGVDYEDHEIYDLSFINKISLRETFALMNECDAYLGVDTGLFHAMAAFNKPQFVFFKNNGCSNNAYHNTYYSDSLVRCGMYCSSGGTWDCHSKYKCMSMFNLDDYYDLIINNMPLNK